MIQNVPSIYNQPSVYNGGGGAPGNFGAGGSAVLPVEYRQVAAIGVPNASSLYARSNFLADEIGLTSFDSTGWVIKCGVYDPLAQSTGGNYCPFFICNPYSNPKIYLQKRGDSKLDVRNGSTTQWSLNAPGGLIKGCDDYVLNGSTLTMNGQIVTNNLAFSGFTFNQMQIIPYEESSYNLYTYGMSSRYLKIYDANGSLFLCFVPCVRVNDGVPGMYEIVHDYFKANSYAFVIDKIEE